MQSTVLIYTWICTITAIRLHLTVIPKSNLDFCFQELVPFFLAPGTGNLVGDQAVPENGGRDVNTILPGKFDWSFFVRRNPQDQLFYKRTGVFQVIGDRYPTIGWTLKLKQVFELWIYVSEPSSKQVVVNSPLRLSRQVCNGRQALLIFRGSEVGFG